MFLLACAEPPGPPMDLHPGRRTASSTWEARVAEGGALTVFPLGRPDAARAIDTDVDARVGFAPGDAALVYARRGGLVETDLWLVELPDGAPVQVTDWRGSEDRPVVSPDGRRLAFVSGVTGLSSWWVVDLDGPLPVARDAAKQLSNVGVEHAPRRPGHPPEGWVPVPDGSVYAWTGDGLSWVAEGARHVVTP